MARPRGRTFSSVERQKMGAMLKAAREAHGLLQRELAARLGVTHSVIAKWETAISAIPRPRWPELEALVSMSFDSFRGTEPVLERVRTRVSAPDERVRDVFRRPELREWWMECLRQCPDHDLDELEETRRSAVARVIEKLLASGSTPALLPGKKLCEFVSRQFDTDLKLVQESQASRPSVAA